MPRLVVISYNIRLDTPRDGPLAWPHRKKGVIDLLRRRRPDICGIQEALPHQLHDLVDGLRCKWVGLAREDGWRRGEFNPILYRRERFELLQTQTFWLSRRPHLPGSRSWDAALPRIVTWARLREESGGELVVFNTHFEYEGESARNQSARRLPRQVSEIAGDTPSVVIGDFNALEASQAYRLLTRRAPEGGVQLFDARYRGESAGEGPSASTNDWHTLDPKESRIDYAFLTQEFEIHRHQLLEDRLPSGCFPSDHLPLEVELSW